MALCLDLWTRIVDRLEGVDAAAFACVSRDAREAYRGSRPFRSVRIARDGSVLRPASGAFDVEVAPGELVASAITRCPRGGSVRLLPGLHVLPNMGENVAVHVFGFDTGTEFSIVSAGFQCYALASSFVGIRFTTNFVRVSAGRTRFQNCVFLVNVECVNDGADSDDDRLNDTEPTTFDRCYFDDVLVAVAGDGTRACFTDNVFRNTPVFVEDGANARFARNTLHGLHGTQFQIVRASATLVGNAIYAPPPNDDDDAGDRRRPVILQKMA